MRLTIEKIMVLKQMPLFSDMTENALSDMLLIGNEQTVEAGRTLLKEGENAGTLTVILSGKINVLKNNKTIKTLTAKDYFGLLFAFDPSKTKYTFTAAEDTVLFKIDGDGLYDLLSEHKEFAHNLIMTMCRRVKNEDRWVDL